MGSIVKSGVVAIGALVFSLFFFIGVTLTQTTTRAADFFTGISSWEYQVQEQTVAYYSDGTEMAKIGYQREYSQDFPEFLKKAVVAVEDRRFYEHHGYDARSIGRAIYNDLRSGSKAEGGSTITQQLARTLFLTQEKSFVRKIKELFIAVSIENKYTKEAILDMYLNEIYTGRGCSGMACAAQSYFGKDVTQLNKAEMTMLAGIIQAPEYYSPDRNMEGLKERQQVVVGVLVDQGIIAPAEGEAIIKQKLTIIPPRATVNQHPYYLAYLTSVLEDKIGAQKLYGGGLKIYTTIDPRMQQAAESSVSSNARSFASRGITAKDIALVSVDPSTGGIRAMVGGADWSKNQINMAIHPRQPGSAIKPLYYAAAINEGKIKASSRLNNAPRDFNGYNPANYAQSPDEVTVTEALVHSYNVASVEVLNQLGVSTAVQYLEKFGITSVENEDHNLALALGGMTRGISPLQMASAYAVFPAQGRHENPFTVLKVLDSRDKIVYQDQSGAQRVLSTSSASAMDMILKAVVTQGTGTNARISVSSGGKTGTTEGKSGSNTSQDLWYVGYTSDLATAVWVGNSDNSPIKGFSAYGGTVAGPIWRDYMNNVIRETTIRETINNPADSAMEQKQENSDNDNERRDNNTDSGNINPDIIDRDAHKGNSSSEVEKDNRDNTDSTAGNDPATAGREE